jgi:hypothetical protein
MADSTDFPVAIDFETHLGGGFKLVEAGDTLTLDLTGAKKVTYTPGAAHANGSASLFPKRLTPKGGAKGQWQRKKINLNHFLGASDEMYIYTALIEPVEEKSTLAITSITQANPGVVTTSSPHGLVNTNKVVFRNIQGMVDISESVATVTTVTDVTFEINIDTSAFGAFTGGTVHRCIEHDTSRIVIAVDEKLIAYGALGEDAALALSSHSGQWR